MATTHIRKNNFIFLFSLICSFYPIGMKFGTLDLHVTWRCEKLNFRNCYAKRCHGNHTHQEKLAWNLAHRTDITWREKWNFRNCYAKRCHGNHTYRGKIISFSFSFCSFYPIGMKLAHRTDITRRCEKWNFRNCYAKRCHGNHTSGKIISFS